MPQTGLDRDHRAARLQQTRRLGEARRERALVGDVVEHEPVEDHVERRRREVEPAGVAEVDLVGPAETRHAFHPLGIGVDRHEPEGGRREQLAPGVPAGADRQDVSAGYAQMGGEQRSFAGGEVSIVRLECRLAAQAIEQVVRIVRGRALPIVGQGHAGSSGRCARKANCPQNRSLVAFRVRLSAPRKRPHCVERRVQRRLPPPPAVKATVAAGQAPRDQRQPVDPGPQLDRAQPGLFEQPDHSDGCVVPQAERVVGLEL